MSDVQNVGANLYPAGDGFGKVMFGVWSIEEDRFSMREDSGMVRDNGEGWTASGTRANSRKPRGAEHDLCMCITLIDLRKA